MKEFEQAKKEEYELKLERAKRDLKNKTETHQDLQKFKSDLEKDYNKRFEEFKANLKEHQSKQQ